MKLPTYGILSARSQRSFLYPSDWFVFFDVLVNESKGSLSPVLYESKKRHFPTAGRTKTQIGFFKFCCGASRNARNLRLSFTILKSTNRRSNWELLLIWYVLLIWPWQGLFLVPPCDFWLFSLVDFALIPLHVKNKGQKGIQGGVFCSIYYCYPLSVTPFVIYFISLPIATTRDFIFE